MAPVTDLFSRGTVFTPEESDVSSIIIGPHNSLPQTRSGTGHNGNKARRQVQVLADHSKHGLVK